MMLVICAISRAQLVVNNTLSPTQLVQDILLGPGIDAYNVTATGCVTSSTSSGDCIGNFSNGNTTNLGLSAGVVMCAGSIFDIPNAASANASIDNGGGSDPQLASLVPGYTIYDATVLEFDFIPNSPQVTFRYVFGSEEYREYVGSSYNDAFGFFLSGPNPGGGNYTNVNLAKIPGTTLPVTINNVNAGSYSQYYVSNSGVTIVYDGFTTVLTATAQVTPCMTYHIKIAIGDAGDHVLDSGIFLEAGSFSGGNSFSVSSASSNPTLSNNAIENCSDGIVTFNMDAPQSNPTTITFTIGGSATNGVDYTTIPTSVTIPAGATSTTLTIHPVQDALTEGDETVQLIVSTPPCGYDTVVVTIQDNPEMAVTVNPDMTICSGDQVNLNATVTGGLSPYSYLWSNGTATAANTVYPVGNDITVNYSVTATDVNGCTASDSVTVTVNQNTSAYAGNDTAVCLGFSTLLSATGGNTYHWSNGDSTVSITVSPVATTIYTVTATDGNGCSDSDSVTVTINQNTSAYVENAVICNGDSAILIASGGISYLWSNGSNSASTTVHPVLTTVYILTATDSNGCSDTTSATVTVNQNPVVSITGTNSTCFGFNNGIAAATVTGGAPGYTYLWSNSLVTQDVSALAVGIYTVTVTDANNCTGMNTVTITEPPALVIITSPDQLICNGQSVPVSVIATGGTGIYSYHWSTGATTQQITIQPITNTTYSVFITDANGCVSATGSTIVNVLPPLNIVLFTNQDTICPGNPISISALVSGGDGGPYYLYNSNNELIDNPYIVYPVGASNYIIIAKDGCGTSVRDTVHVALYPVPEATFTADKMSGCVPLTVYFLPMVFQPGFQYSWSFGENQSISTSGNPSHIFQSPGSYDISLTVENQYGCTSTETISHMINAYPVPLASFNANPITTSILKPEIEFYNNSDGAVNYLWSFGDGDSSNNINPVHNYPAPGNYTIQMIAVSNHGCKDSISMTVMVNDEFTFYAPNYFSPDGDGINDVFKVFGYGIDNSYFKLYIYDRWGEIIFISTDIEEGWNGYVGSKMSQNGTYTWLVNFKKISGVSVTKYGAANLIR